MDVRTGHEIFQHECKTPGCTTIVTHDDEPWCAGHSPNSTPCVPGYSAKAEEKQLMQEKAEANHIETVMTDNDIPVRQNIFE